MEEPEDDDAAPFEGEVMAPVAVPVDVAPTSVDVSSVLPGGLVTAAGEHVVLRDLVDREEYSTVEFAAEREEHAITAMRGAFTYGQAQPVMGAIPPRWATAADTSLQRAGSMGLPQGWHGWVFGWRARAIGPREVLDADVFHTWTATVTASFRTRGKEYARLPLNELLAAPKPMSMAPPEVTALRLGEISRPVQLWEHLDFGVALIPEDPATCSALRRALIQATGVDDRHRLLLTRLEAMGGPVAAAVIEELRPQPIKIRVFLRGWWQRTVV